MPYAISPDDGSGVLTVVVSGTIDADIAPPMVTEARAAAAARNAGSILYDFRGAAPGKVSGADIFWFPRNIPALATPGARRTRIALLTRTEHAPIARLWETSFTNVGLQARAFHDEEAARRWLAERPGA
jgi:hypothetical protein